MHPNQLLIIRETNCTVHVGSSVDVLRYYPLTLQMHDLTKILGRAQWGRGML